MGFPELSVKSDDLDALVPVHLISSGDAPASHRFYDSSPISPSGRFAAYTEFPYEDRLPLPGDIAFVVIVDLEEGKEFRRLATSAWDTQLGAQVQWGATDRQVYFNRMHEDTWTPYGVCFDLVTDEVRELEGTVYHVSPDGKFALSPSLTRIGLVQPGYGVIVPQHVLGQSTGFVMDDGLFITDLMTGKTKILVSFSDIVSAHPETFKELKPNLGCFYGFHTKWAPNGKRIIFIVRWRDHAMRKGQSKNWIVTMNPDGSNLNIAMTAARWVGGHHPNWCPDGNSIIMNLAFRNPKIPFPKLFRLMERVLRKFRINWHSGAYQLRFAQFQYDGSDLSVLAPSQIGSGHPTMHSSSDF